MSFNGNEGAFISLTDAAALTATYRNSGTLNPVLGQFLGKTKLNQLLAQSGCVGLRIYYGVDATGAPAIVVVGVSSNENDILGTNPKILDTALPCPPNCGNSNSLNS
jgi:hypothetical protein